MVESLQNVLTCREKQLRSFRIQPGMSSVVAVLLVHFLQGVAVDHDKLLHVEEGQVAVYAEYLDLVTESLAAQL